MNTIQYKGYTGTVQYIEEDDCFYATVEGIKDGLITEAQSTSELKQNYHRIIDEYLDFCQQHKRTPDQQASGRFQIRIKPQIHAILKAQAAAKPDKTSINDLINQILDEKLAH